MYRFGTSIEETCIRKIEAGIRGLKNGTKTPQEANCGYFLNKLKDLNDGMYQDLLAQYIEAKNGYDKKNEK